MFPVPSPQLDIRTKFRYNTPMLKTLTKRTTRIEISARELAILENALFSSMVRLMMDSKMFDILNPDDDMYMMEGNMEADIIKGLNRKLEFARKMIEAEPTD